MPVKSSGQTYSCLDSTRFWLDKCLSSGIIRLHFTVKYMWTVIIILTTQHTLLLSLQWRLYRGRSNNLQLPENEKTLLPPRHAGLLKFFTAAEPQNSGKSVKFTKIHTVEILPNTYMSVQRIWDLSQLFFVVKLQIYLETLIRLLIRKTGHWPGQCTI